MRKRFKVAAMISDALLTGIETGDFHTALYDLTLDALSPQQWAIFQYVREKDVPITAKMVSAQFGMSTMAANNALREMNEYGLLCRESGQSKSYPYYTHWINFAIVPKGR